MITIRGTIKTIVVIISILFVTFLSANGALASKPSTEIEKGVKKETKAKVMETYGRLPLYFIKNDGQIDEKVKYYEKGSGHSTYFTEEGIYLSLVKGNKGDKREKRKESKETIHGSSIETEYIKLCPLNMEKGVEIIGESRQEGKVNYFIGNDPEKWRTDIPTYKAVIYRGIYKGIDIKFYGNHRQLEYDIIVKPGAEPSAVRFAYEGAEGIRVTELGDLEISLKHGKIIQRKPHIYQEVGGKKVEVGGRFKILNSSTYELESTTNQYIYGFEVAKYDNRYPLIIDPILAYSTYLGGSGYDVGLSIALDSSGSAYITGVTSSNNFPTANPFQGSHGGGDVGGGMDAFITKLNPAGSALVYSTYFGGSGEDEGICIAVDSLGSAYITGLTSSNNFPTANPFQGSHGGGVDDTFITKFNPSGSALIYSTYLGGSEMDIARGIAVDSLGSAYITGVTCSTNFPTVNPIQGQIQAGCHGFITKLNPAGSALVYSTYIGGSSDDDEGMCIAVDSLGSAYITGFTSSSNFPTANPFQGSHGGGSMDAFVAKLNPAGSALVYSTYLGGSGDDLGSGIAVDSSGSAYITGWTESTDFPITNSIQGSFAGDRFDGFITKLNPAGSALVYSTYLGGSGNDIARGIAVDTLGSAYLTGVTGSTNFPTVNSIQGTNAGGYDIFITKLNPAGSALIYSTYLGGSEEDYGDGIAVDTSGSAYVTGYTDSDNFPTVSPFQGSHGGGFYDAFVAKLADITETISTPTTPTGPANGTTGINYIYFTGGSTSSLGHGVQYLFDWGDGTNSGWLPVGTTYASKFWTSTGIFSVKAQAQCAIDISVVSDWSPGLTVTITTPIALQSPLNSAHFNACSLFLLPTFSWTLGESFDDLEIQFSSDQSFNSISVKVKGLGTATQTTMTKNTWKKVLSTPGPTGGTVYWRVVGTRPDKTTATSESRFIVIDPAQQVGSPTISPTTKSSLPTLSWQNNCNIKFKAWFGKDNTFTKKTSFVFNIINPTNNGGIFSKQLNSGQWMSIKRVVGNVSGSTIYWYVESWDGVKRYAKTEVMSFLLTD